MVRCCCAMPIGVGEARTSMIFFGLVEKANELFVAVGGYDIIGIGVTQILAIAFLDSIVPSGVNTYALRQFDVLDVEFSWYDIVALIWAIGVDTPNFHVTAHGALCEVL